VRLAAPTATWTSTFDQCDPAAMPHSSQYANSSQGHVSAAMATLSRCSITIRCSPHDCNQSSTKIRSSNTVLGRLRAFVPVLQGTPDNLVGISPLILRTLSYYRVQFRDFMALTAENTIPPSMFKKTLCNSKHNLFRGVSGQPITLKTHTTFQD
jgi:hypothetical protein